jgi:ABC-2 type transport system permease protein
MTTLAVHARLSVLQLARLPSFVVPTLAFPVMLFVFFGIGQASSPPAANAVMASFAAFAVLGVVLFQFGVGIANERDTPWERYVRTLPVAAGVRVAARLTSAGVFAAAAALVVVATAALTTPMALSPVDGARLAAVLALGALPFGLLGIAIGYWASPRGALPVANLIYLPLAYAGGLWALPQHLPPWVAALSPWLPTGQWAELLRAAALGAALSWTAVVGLVVYGIGFAVAALVGYRRDEAREYS